MARLVRLTVAQPDKPPIYVNPDHVAALEPCHRRPAVETYVYLGGREDIFATVIGSAHEVATRLLCTEEA